MAKSRMKKIIWTIVFLILCVPTLIKVGMWSLYNILKGEENAD